MSNIPDQIKETSASLNEPTWLLDWRMKQHQAAQTLPTARKHGIGITALFPESEPDFSGFAEYHVEPSKGLEIYTWKEALVQEEIAPLIRGFLESEFFPKPTDHFRALALSRFTSGLVLYVQPNMDQNGTFVTETLRLKTTLGDHDAADVIIVIAKAGAKFDLLCETLGGASGNVFSRTLFVVTERDALVRVSDIADLKEGAMRMTHAKSLVSGNARLMWRSLFTDAGLHSDMTEHALIGPKANVSVRQAIVGTASGIYDIDVAATHHADDAETSIVTRGVASGASRTLYRGLIDMKEGVHRVKGEQDAKFLVMSKTAKVDAIPSLDIASNDVTCVHKLAVTHVKEGDVFYPKLRGLSDDESRSMFLEGHMAEAWKGEENIDMMTLTLPALISTLHA